MAREDRVMLPDALKFEVAAMSGLVSGFASGLAAIQTILNGNTWIPLGVVVSLFVAAIAFTWKASRYLSMLESRLEKVEKKTKDILG